MREVHFFYDPCVTGELPEEEARHAVRVLRLEAGDEVSLMDGHGTFYRVRLTAVSNHRCRYELMETLPQPPAWQGHIHIAMAPTKLSDRTEWLAEKATEIGIDEITFLDCQFSERHVIKTERIGKILVAAMKQSHKATLPALHEMTSFGKFVRTPREGDRFICHCYDPADIGPGSGKPHLMDVLRPGASSTVLVGPEGDFSIDEVRLAESCGYRSVSLGSSRLRTETAALVSVHMMQLKNRIL